ncbi:hypothetical protein FACS1894204_10460 [Synergistales bacterium]|nr:hypothetical protein FACS1894204_10460 [Synergistales bacterium]
MDDKGEIISSIDIDEKLSLQIWTKGLSPRVVVFNKLLDKKKFVRLSWFEEFDRKLTIKGRKGSEMFEYAVSDILPAIQRILSEYAVYTSFKPYLWKFAATFDRVLHAPAVVLDRKEFAILSEEKKTRLWIADLTGDDDLDEAEIERQKRKGTWKKDSGFFVPFFPLLPSEKKTFPEAGMPFSDGFYDVEDLFLSGAVRKLNGASVRRWHRPLRIMSVALLLNFSYCEEDGQEFSDELWRVGRFEEPLNLKIGDYRLRGMGRKAVAYIRHFDALRRVSVRASFDGENELLSQDYARKRRIGFPPGLLGRGETSVTFFERSDGMMALACRPSTKSSGKGSGSDGRLYYASPPQKSHEKQELIYTLPREDYDAALVNDTFKGDADDYFTVSQIAGAKIFEAWCDSLTPYIKYFAGFVDV